MFINLFIGEKFFNEIFTVSAHFLSYKLFKIVKLFNN